MIALVLCLGVSTALILSLRREPEPVVHQGSTLSRDLTYTYPMPEAKKIVDSSPQVPEVIFVPTPEPPLHRLSEAPATVAVQAPLAAPANEDKAQSDKLPQSEIVVQRPPWLEVPKQLPKAEPTEKKLQALSDRVEDLLHSASRAYEDGRFLDCMALAKEAQSLHESTTATFWLLRAARHLDDLPTSKKALDWLKSRPAEDDSSARFEGGGAREFGADCALRNAEQELKAC